MAVYSAVLRYLCRLNNITIAKIIIEINGYWKDTARVGVVSKELISTPTCVYWQYYIPDT